VAHAGEEIRNATAGLTLRLLQTGADTDGQLLEMEATYEPSSIEPVEHFHPRQDALRGAGGDAAGRDRWGAARAVCR
jgi:hypothetical protein